MGLTTHHSIVLVALANAILEAYTSTFLFSYTPHMVIWFGYQERNKGFYVGVIVAAYYFGALMTNYPLGLLADRHGHRNIIVGINIANAVGNVCIGFARDIYTVVILRVMAGGCSVVFALSRAIISIFCENHRQAQAFALHQTGFITGLMLASVVGGYLVAFTENYPDKLAGSYLLIKYPYVIPPMIDACMSILAAFVTFWLYPKKLEEQELETNSTVSTKYSTFDGIPLTSSGLRKNTTNVANELDISTQSTDNISKTDIQESIRKNTTNGTSELDISSTESTDISKTDKAKFLTKVHKSIKESVMLKLLRNTNTVKAIIAYCLIAGTLTTFVELFAVWSSTPTDLSGLAYRTDDIGLIVAIVTIPAAIAQLILYPLLEKRFGSIASLIGFMVIAFTTVTVVPLTRFIVNHTTQWVTLTLLQFLVRFADSAGVSAISVITNNSVPKTLAGAVNGLSFSCYTGVTMVMPLVCGSMYAASIKSDIGGPIDASLVFVYMGIHCFIVAIITYTLPPSLNQALEVTV